MTRRPLVLVLYYATVWPLRVAIRDHLYCFSRDERLDTVYVNLAIWRLPNWLVDVPFDVIVFHTSFLAVRWNRDRFAWLRARAGGLRTHPARKVAIPQDEFLNVDLLAEFFAEFDVDDVMTCAPHSEWGTIYGDLPTRVRFTTVLTGYLADRTVAKAATMSRSVRTRNIDIGYRAWTAAPWLGRHGQLKVTIAKVFDVAAREHLLSADISIDEHATIVGDDWLRFLSGCRYTIGVEGGASLLDRDGSVRARTEAYLRAHPAAPYEEVEAACFPTRDGELRLFALSPRHLEAVATRTVQILVVGNYNGVLHRDVHYIPLQPDFGNLDEVIERLRDERERVVMADRAYDDVVLSGRYSYRAFVDTVVRPDEVRSGPGTQAGMIRWARNADAATWTAVAAGRRLKRAVDAVRSSGQLHRLHRRGA